MWPPNVFPLDFALVPVEFFTIGSVGIVVRLRVGLSGFLSTPGRNKIVVSFPKRPVGPWGSPSLLSTVYRVYFLGVKAAGA